MSYIRFNFFPLTLQVNWGMDLVLPKKFDSDEKLPLVCLLHDDRENYTSWFRNVGLERLADKYHAAIALLDSAQGLYTDMKDGYPFFTFITKEAPELLHKNFNPLTWDFSKVLLVGKGIGAYGAAKWALHSELAPAGVIAIDPILQIEEWYKEIQSKEPERLYRLINAWGEEASYNPEENRLDRIACQKEEKIPMDLFETSAYKDLSTPAFTETLRSSFRLTAHPTEEEDIWTLANDAIAYGIETYLKEGE